MKLDLRNTLFGYYCPDSISEFKELEENFFGQNVELYCDEWIDLMRDSCDLPKISRISSFQKSLWQARLNFLKKKKSLISSIINQYNWYLGNQVNFYIKNGELSIEIQELEIMMNKLKIICKQNYNVVRVVSGMEGIRYAY